MRALVVENNSIQLRDVEMAPLAPGECRIRVRQTGICKTDLELVKGYMGFRGIPGHEFVGEVVEGSERLQGRRVVGEINAACGHCERCARGMQRHCEHRTVLGIFKRPGTFAEFIDLPAENLLTVPDSVADEEAVFVEPLAAAFEIFEQTHIPPGSRMLVIGDGKLGLLITQLACHFGHRVTLMGRHEKKLALARRWGADATLPREQLAKFPFVVECTGTPGALKTALDCTVPRGTLILKSTYAPEAPPQIDWAKIVIDEISIIGSRCGPFAPALRLLASGRFDVKCLIDHRKSFGQCVEAFELAARPGVLKVVVTV